MNLIGKTHLKKLLEVCNKHMYTCTYTLKTNTNTNTHTHTKGGLV